MVIKGIDAPDAAAVLIVVEVPGDKFPSAGNPGGGEDKGVPKRDLPAGLPADRGQEEVKGVVHDRPLGMAAASAINSRAACQ